MAEWLKAHAWKACVGETLPRVRIPLSPPTQYESKRLRCVVRSSPQIGPQTKRSLQRSE